METIKRKVGRPKIGIKSISIRIPEPILPMVKEIMANYRASLKKAKEFEKGKKHANQNSK
jgi:hypothetical protein